MIFLLTALHCALLLAFRIPLAIIAYIKSLLFKNKRIQPTLFQRILSAISKTIGLYTTISFVRIISGYNRWNWVKKLDARNERDGWEGYLIADCVKQSEIGRDADMIILYIHGGGFVNGSALTTLDMFIDWIKRWKFNHGVNTQILSLEYRLSPKYPFPAARDNVLECYNWLVTEKEISPSKIVFAGDSAGGNLAVVSAAYLVNNPHTYSIDPPSALILISPLLSAITKAQSFINNASYDCIDRTQVRRCMDAYIGNSNLHPSCSTISPLFESQLSGLPKVWTCVGGYEIFLDDIKTFVGKLINNDVKARLTIEDTNFHDYAIAKVLSRDDAYDNSIRQIGRFLYTESGW